MLAVTYKGWASSCHPAIGTAGVAVSVEVGGGGDGEDAPGVITGDLPAPLVDHPVVAVAEQDEVAKVGLSAVAPVGHVVGRTPGGTPLRDTPLARVVAHVQRPPRGAR